MSSRNYYSLVAGLREYALDADTKGFDAKGIVEEILDGVCASDASEVRLLYGYYDCENILALRAGRSAHNPLGNLSREELEQELKTPSRLPQGIARVVKAYADPEGEEAEEVDTSRRFETTLFAAYYDACRRSRSRFLRVWSEFDRTLRNVMAALAARAASRPVEEVVVGGGDVAEQLAMNDEANLMEKERKIDLVRWEEASELATFDYFNINAILSYLVRINIVARWARLDAARGREMFNRLLAELDGKELINK